MRHTTRMPTSPRSHTPPTSPTSPTSPMSPMSPMSRTPPTAPADPTERVPTAAPAAPSGGGDYAFDLDAGRACLDFANTLSSSGEHLTSYADLDAFAAQSQA